MTETDPKQTLVIGASGLVGSGFIGLCPPGEEIISTSNEELDILKPNSIQETLEKYQPDGVINLAAHTNLDKAEQQRGDKSGIAWQLNVQGAKNVAEVCNKQGIFLIHISTDAVFPGTEDFPGPYAENIIPPNKPENLSWYGYTKLQGEKAVQETCSKAAIVRISYPFGNPDLERDFAKKTLSYIQAGYSLFNDQYFTPTFIPDLTKALLKIIHQPKKGIYHVACHGLTTPFEFGAYLASQAGLKQEIKAGSAVDWLKTPGRPARAIKGGLMTRHTEDKLQLKFHTWQEAIDSFLQKP